jgi:hypothetical protein
MRLLVPAEYEFSVGDMLTDVKHVVVSRTIDAPAEDIALEIMFEDDSEAPFFLHLSGSQVDLFPAKSDAQRKFAFDVYVNRDGPKRIFSTTALFRVAPRLPWTKKADPKRFR